MKRIIIVSVLLVTSIAVIVTLNQRTVAGDPIASLAGATMGTSYHIKISAEGVDAAEAKRLQDLVDNRLTIIDQLMSTYKQSSEISQFNRLAANHWLDISPETLLVIQAGQHISELSDGAFDMTVGKLVNLWGFGPTININLIPDPQNISALQQQIGYKKLQLRDTPPGILKSSEAIYLDLSAIAKGYAVDAVATVLEEQHISNYMVEIGGEIRTAGFKSNQQPWAIGIESPTAAVHNVQKVLHLSDAAMATSGDYRNYFEDNGKRYSHTIDPRSGYPIEHRLASVTVICEDCMTADALATAIMVMGPEKGLQFAELHNIPIFMIIKQGEHFTERQSTSFNPYLK